VTRNSSLEQPTSTGWVGSPLATDIHELDLPEDALPWRDNAFLLFWDGTNEIFGSAHVSSSPNGEGLRARFTVLVDGQKHEIVEPLERGTFTSQSISYGLMGDIVVESPTLSAKLRLEPRYGVGDYAKSGLIPSLVAGEPLQHFQQFLSVTGHVTVDGSEHAIDAGGLRDRTWGFRDESKAWQEYIGVTLMFPDGGLSIVRMLGTDGSDRTEGHLLGEVEDRLIDQLGVTRDPSGLFAKLHYRFVDGDEFEISLTSRLSGCWVPMGHERRAPLLSAYDEFVRVERSDGQVGIGAIEHAVLRNIY
jgi:hypothetical protein